ncbi:ATP-binding protein [Natronoflexus pectinivorans]|uniref:histidine kinase n=1 Tax=Natronoflexus pectinivorans TaxID=682526 RepID=A0A4R2GIN3_9BACT|nr:ATP-binding protein [Natronoflexus pectinivorans]TCO08378.1 cyclic nucleotide-binding protein [Natronoflexus pectinivorans]
MNSSKKQGSLHLTEESTRSLYDKEIFVQNINQLITESELLKSLLKTFEEGEVLLEEGMPNKTLYVVLEGEVSQHKEGEDITADIGLLGPGEFCGLLSFQTGEPIFITIKAQSQVKTLAFDHNNFDLFYTKYPEISRTLNGLIFSNLAERYRNMLGLHLEVAKLTRELEKEKNQLRKTIKELERTRNAYISQEKMATLGELTAGLAHEINNPASALLRSVDYLSQNLSQLVESSAKFPSTTEIRYFFDAGLSREYADSIEQRGRMKSLAGVFSHLQRSKIRMVAEMNDDLIERLMPYSGKKSQQELLNLLIDAYQSGLFLNGIRLSTSRIEFLVKSLKSYSRQSGKSPEMTDIRNGIRETLQILGHRLKSVKVHLNLEEIPLINCFVGELNQVWTNLIINACDAMNDSGNLYISCGVNSANDLVWVKIADDGPGVPDKIKKKIFQPSFTTKTAGGDFGLGIGLAITQGVIEKHQGTISITDRDGGGAEFLMIFPIDE